MTLHPSPFEFPLVVGNKCTFGFKPCVFGLRQLGQKMAFQNNIVLQMYLRKTQASQFKLVLHLYIRI
jgi:hypothetical protein